MLQEIDNCICCAKDFGDNATTSSGSAGSASRARCRMSLRLPQPSEQKVMQCLSPYGFQSNARRLARVVSAFSCDPERVEEDDWAIAETRSA
eukprot:4040712-Amphidinium_carterae.1